MFTFLTAVAAMASCEVKKGQEQFGAYCDQGKTSPEMCKALSHYCDYKMGAEPQGASAVSGICIPNDVASVGMCTEMPFDHENCSAHYEHCKWIQTNGSAPHPHPPGPGATGAAEAGLRGHAPQSTGGCTVIAGKEPWKPNCDSAANDEARCNKFSSYCTWGGSSVKEISGSADSGSVAEEVPVIDNSGGDTSGDTSGNTSGSGTSDLNCTVNPGSEAWAQNCIGANESYHDCLQFGAFCTWEGEIPEDNCRVKPGFEAWSKNCVSGENDIVTCQQFGAYCDWYGPESTANCRVNPGSEAWAASCTLGENDAAVCKQYYAFCTWYGEESTTGCQVKPGMEAWVMNCEQAMNDQYLCYAFTAYCEWMG